jgi:2-polyprenyl-6-methoxyphenol hydroxylase-like FAD-dependent oxidoreductase
MTNPQPGAETSNEPSLRPLDVLVVGAGPTGLALAAQLHAYGARFRIIDRALDRAHESRALGVQPRTLEVLAGLGITDELVRHGNRAVRVKLHFGHRVARVQLFDIGTSDTQYPYLLFISQAHTERIFGEHLTAQGVKLERGSELVDLHPGTDGVNGAMTCRLRHSDGTEEVIQARYVVGCDGAHSTVRDQAGIGFEGSAYPQTFVLADVEADGIEPGNAHAFLSARGILLFFPLGSPATWRILAMRPRTDTTPVEQPVTLAEAQALVDTYTSIPVRLRDPVWMTNFRLYNRGATHYRTGGVFLAGDAAHIHSPAGAQGMNTGIQDAINLGWKLALVTANRANPGLLDTYEPERAPVGRRVLRFTDRAFTVATSTNPLVRLARTQIVPHVIPLALRSRRGRVRGFRTVSQLAIRYPRSPLSVNGPDLPRSGPKAGDRLPDAPVTQSDQVVTLHRALARPGFHALLCGPVAAWSGSTATELAERYGDLVTVHRLTRGNAPGALWDHTGQASDRLGLRDQMDTVHYLIRPDGHIGYCSGGADLQGLHTYLERWTRPGINADI